MKRLGVFVLLSMALGGLAGGFTAGGNLEALLCAGGIWALCVLSGENRSGQRQYVKVEIHAEGNRVMVMALVDSGNSLKDPITGEQVLVLGPEEAEKLAGLSLLDIRDPMGTMMMNPGMRLRLIPCHTVAGSGLLLGKRFADVWIDNNRCGALVAFSPEKIGTGETFQALAGGMQG